MADAAVKREPASAGPSAGDDRETLASLRREPAAAAPQKRPANAGAVEDDEDDEDDIPLVELKRRRLNTQGTKLAKAALPAKSNQAAAKAAKAKAAAKPKREKATKAEKPSSKKGRSTPVRVKAELGQPFKFVKDAPLKPQLVHRLQVRWWYVIEWPDEAAIGEAPPGYIMLPGFKGVFVGVEGEFLGEILDRRDDATKPSYRNLMRKPADELQALLIQAIQVQREKLVQLEETEDCDVVRALDAELQEVERLSAENVERQAKKKRV